MNTNHFDTKIIVAVVDIFVSVHPITGRSVFLGLIASRYFFRCFVLVGTSGVGELMTGYINSMQYKYVVLHYT